MNNLSYERKKKIMIIAIATIIAVLGILLAIVLATNSENEVPASEEEDTRTHQTTVPDGYTGVYNANDLTSIASDSSNLTKNYILMADINISGIDFAPIGDSATPFKGIFDGNNYIISSLNINSANQYVGLFGYINGGTVKNLSIKNATIKSTYTNTSSAANAGYVGAVIGYDSGSKVENVSVIGESRIESIGEANTTNIGGVIGYTTNGYISNSSSNANIIATSTTGAINAGGLVGCVYEARGGNANWNVIVSSNATGNLDITSTNGVVSAGGLIGYAYTGNNQTTNGKASMNINNVYATGDINSNSNGAQYIGGLIGRGVGNRYTSKSSNYTVNINSTYATGDVEATSTNKEIHIGGLVGNFGNGTISISYSTGGVIALSETGIIHAGGLIGYAYGGSTSNNSRFATQIENAYTLGNVTTQTGGIQYVGGLIGDASGYYVSTGNSSHEKLKVINTYAVGKVNVGGTGTKKVGGLIGDIGKYTFNGTTTTYLLVDATNSYWSPETTGQSASTLGIPRLLHNMLHEASYKDWDFENIWTIEQNGGSLPYLKNMVKPETVNKESYEYETFEEGEGTEENPYIVKTEKELQAIKYDVNKTYYKLGNDINLQNKFEPIGDERYPFAGSFDGAGHKISNLSIESDNQYIGLFGYTNEGTIKNLILEDAIVKSTYTNTSSAANAGYVGAVIGYDSESKVENVSVIGESRIESIGEANTTNIGGVIGYTTNGYINDSNSNANIIATSTTGAINAGGLVGCVYEARGGNANWNVIVSSNATGNLDITSTSGVVSAGGLIGYAYTGRNINNKGNASMDINNVYATGNINSNSNGAQYIGGLIGRGIGNHNSSNDSNYTVNVNSTYATGNVDATSINKEIHTGGLIGNFGNGTVEISYSTGEVTALSETGVIHAGGLIGYAYGGAASAYNPFDTRIENAYTLGNVTTQTGGTKYAGGLVGDATGYYFSTGNTGHQKLKIINTYAVGRINASGTGTNKIGGLIGDIGQYTFNGNVRPTLLVDVTNSYWSPKTTGQETSALGESKTIQELLYRSGYANSWDFNEIWTIEPNGGSLAYFGKLPRPDGVLVENLPYETRISVGKEDENKKPLSGANFIIKDESGAIVRQGSSNSNGIFYVFDLEEGIYTLQETQAPSSYIKDDTEYKFRLTREGKITDIITGEEISLKVVNTKSRANVTITKTGQIKGCDENILLEGAKIAVYSSDGTKIQEKVTDEDGAVTFESLESGTYSYRETVSPEGYEINNNLYTFNINEDGTIVDENSSNIYNNQKNGTIVVRKYSSSTYDLLQGAVIGLFDQNGNKICDEAGNIIKKTTNKQGFVVFTGLEPGVYQYRELSAPTGYKNNNNMYKVTINEDWTVEYETDYGKIYDIKGKDGGVPKVDVTIDDPRKPGDDKPIHIEDKDGEKILDENGDPIEGIPSDDGNDITFPGLEPGEYIPDIPGDSDDTNPPIKIIVDDDGNYTVYKNVIVIKRESGTEKVLSGVKIGLYKVGDTETKIGETKETNINGKAIFSYLSEGRYYYKEEESVPGYVINTTKHYFTVASNGKITFDNYIEKDGTTYGVIYNNRATMKPDASFDITKKKTGTDIVLAGAKIGIFNEAGTKVEEATTEEAGTIRVSGLEVGRYYYQETEAPAGYVLNDTKYYFTVNNDGTVIFDTGSNKIIYNNRATMTDDSAFTITKKKTGTDIVIAGAKIGVFDSENNKVIEATTGEAGTIRVSGLEVGRYYYQETEAPAGYVLNDTKYYFTVNNDGTVTFDTGTDRVIYNTKVTMTDGLEVVKKKTGSNIVVAGAKIGVFNSENNKVIEATTGEAGTIRVSGLEVGRYYYQETEAPAGYILNNTKYYFTVNNDGTVTLEEGSTGVIYNNRVTMKPESAFDITKKKTGTDIVIAGAKIGIFDSENSKVIEATTEETGIIRVSGLEVGRYYYQETEAPAGYVLNNTKYYFTVNNDGTVTFDDGTTKVIYNNRVTMKPESAFDITKKKTGTDIVIAGAKIGIFDSEDNKVIEATTEEAGTIRVSGLEVGRYYYQETKAPAGYVLNNTKYYFTVNNDGTVTFDDDSNRIIYNTQMEFEVDVPIYKIDKITNQKIKGAKIQLYNELDEAIMQEITDENGVAIFKDLIKGKRYKYKEITAPVGYKLNKTVYSFIINNDGTISYEGEADGIIYNEPIRLTITKKDILTRKLLAGAEIALYDETGDVVSGTTLEDGTITFGGLIAGKTYRYKELKAPIGYVLNETMYTVKIGADGEIIYEDNADGIIYNERIRVDVPIYKMEKGTRKLLSGAVIGLYDKDGNPVLENGEHIKVITNIKGVAMFSKLEVGKIYQYKEEVAPLGYKLNGNSAIFRISEDGTIMYDENEGIIYNEKVLIQDSSTSQGKLPQTGVNTVIQGALLMLTGFSMAGAVYYKKK